MKIKTQLTQNNLTREQEIRLFRLFASWSKKRKYEYIKKSPKERALRLKYTWRAWARDSQLAPDGDWATWCVISGRGWGKTRTGAEWIIEKAEQYPGCHIALVGRTVADVRDVMVKGRSGILSVSPPWFMPTYYPSKRQLVWPNGSYATTYSADEPDQLRGPQHSFAWADERCFVAGTLIRTSEGLRPIEEIQPGDLVYTREGLKRVKHAGLTNPSTTVYDLITTDGRVLTGTGNHPIWVQNKGFKPLHSLSYGDILMTWDQVKLGIASCGVGVGGGSMEDITATVEESCCTEPSTQPLMDLFHQECISTTKTVTKLTTISPTLKQSPLPNTLRGTLRKDGERGERSDASRLHGNNGTSGSLIWQPASIVAKSSRQQARLRSSAPQHVEQRIDAKTLLKYKRRLASGVEHHSWSTGQECSTVLLSAHMQIDQGNNQSSAQIAEKSLPRTILEQSAAHANVVFSTSNKIEERSKEREVASSVTKPSRLNSPHLKKYSAQNHAVTYTDTENSSNCTSAVLCVRRRTEKMAVFNMEVEDCHEYYANDILVHNCSWQYDDAWDQLSFGLRIEPFPGVQPQCVVTTTPRNTKSLKALLADPSTIVTRGKTYDNRDNLSPRFIREIERRYAGTRLGRQEIEGDIIDDIDGALWKRDWIERNRVVVRPDLKRIVVAIDPPAASPETSEDPAECGIIVSGLGLDGHGYVLADYSLVGTPNEWGSAALVAYGLFEADLIVGEVNNGGDMVEAVIRSVAKDKGLRNVPFKAVRASRGKQLRAEPISNLYQQDMVHHVGTHPDLEDQQCNWVPGEKSPDRLDSAVWALTELMLDGKGMSKDAHMELLQGLVKTKKAVKP